MSPTQVVFVRRTSEVAHEDEVLRDPAERPAEPGAGPLWLATVGEADTMKGISEWTVALPYPGMSDTAPGLWVRPPRERHRKANGTDEETVTEAALRRQGMSEDGTHGLGPAVRCFASAKGRCQGRRTEAALMHVIQS